MQAQLWYSYLRYAAYFDCNLTPQTASNLHTYFSTLHAAAANTKQLTAGWKKCDPYMRSMMAVCSAVEVAKYVRIVWQSEGRFEAYDLGAVFAAIDRILGVVFHQLVERRET
jgi:hypothetical protein